VGEALWATQQAYQASQSNNLFPRYCDGNQVKANSASAALNKWMKCQTKGDYVIHGFRHSMRDRLRAVQCPSDVIDQLGGWSTAGVGQSYGEGYDIAAMYAWMELTVRQKI
jgi:integrase